MKKYTIAVVAFLLIAGLVIVITQSCNQDLSHKNFSTADLNEQLVTSILWMQTSAEYRALCYQTYHLARINLDHFLKNYKKQKPLAIIVDADETVLDNTAYEAFLIGKNFGYSSDTWNPWLDAAKAQAIPGAVEFLHYASEKGVEIFYITNRRVVGYQGTEQNLKELGFPNVDKKHLLLRTDTSNKQPRRDIVDKDYTIVFLMGDNLNDFLHVFAGKSVEDRFSEVEKYKSEWGKKFIVLPNPMYGEWEGALYDYNWGANAAEKDKMRKSYLRRWDYNPN